MGSGNRNKVFFLSFFGRIFFQLLVMKDKSQAARLTTYIHLSPNLPKTIFGENTHWECRHIKIPPRPPFACLTTGKLYKGGKIEVSLC
jgi:hypothetical protein